MQGAVQLGRLGERGVGLGEAALGEQGAGDRAVHAGHQRGVTGAGREGEGEFGGLRGARVGAHVHVRADRAGVEQQQRVGIVQTAAVQLVQGGLQQVHGVPQFTGEVVRERASAQGGDPGGQRGPGIDEALLGPLEVLASRGQFAGLHGTLAEPEQRGGPLLGQLVRLGLGEQPGVLRGRLLRALGGEGALRLGEPESQVGGEAGGSSGDQLLVSDTEPVGEVPQRLVGGADAAGLQGGDVGGCVRRFRELALGHPALGAQALHPASDVVSVVTVPHCQLPMRLLPFGADGSRLNRVLSALNRA